MSSYTATFFIGRATHVRGNPSPIPVLYVEPDGHHKGGYIAFQMDANLPVEQQLAVAEQFTAAVTAWRDALAARAADRRVDEGSAS